MIRPCGAKASVSGDTVETASSVTVASSRKLLSSLRKTSSPEEDESSSSEDELSSSDPDEELELDIAGVCAEWFWKFRLLSSASSGGSVMQP